ncbi:LacI family DNA-binding transcriptional regulator [Trueperella sp. LYQ143]|uniref:LacI family DNA-binding transcriptional regulator n=1 Tax=unclassified Trueperella TaxID=2630174 RepID=UPI00398368A0
MKAKGRPPGMMDVAKLAGVSHQTVSRVLNGSDKVAPHTREAVEQAIATLGYRRNSVARALVTSRSGIIGIISSAEPAYGPSSILMAIEVAVRRAGYFTGVAPMLNWDAASLEEACDHLLSLAVEALIVIAPFEVAGGIEALHNINVPVIVVAAQPVNINAGQVSVCVDQVSAVRQAMQHLLDLGHRKIAHIEGPQEWYEAVCRKEAWRNALNDAGISTQYSCGGGWDAVTGYQAVEQLFAQDAPTAIFAANDVLAMGAIRALHEAGLRVPQDVSIIGFDDIPGISHLVPPLTTIHQDFERLAKAVVRTMTSAIDGEKIGQVEAVAADLVIRQSTAAVRND